ncbi:serine/threonine protein kinase [Herbihabitans rhizosphaerae]|uniref:Serine/threonine protein kinase n=1 Tax=Herbihabitans rhizosphaerae TaxID=1872711 RepID=A0A4Q7KCW5_9PSEU|nr:serine/threonine-protein kinase [Herbihabitans rhizosphaerae]RZS31378.1 serine/threonine protein kinase [Herbihabitans rhizosphaerae]
MHELGASDVREVGNYHLIASLGQGGMGTVALGVAPDGRLVAVKQVHSGFARDEDFRARFRREVDASRMVSGAYTAAVVDADPNADIPWLASTFVIGPSLDTTGPLPEESVLRLAAGLATALAEIHRVGLIHRDLKPSNVLLAEDGPRVIDFGIARAAEGNADLTHTGSVIGSPGFMSPEQAEGRDLTPASDMFSLGTILAMATTGRGPFAGPSAPATLYNVVHNQPDLTGVPERLLRIIEPCLAKQPEARPSPRALLALVGRVPPAAKPWPPAVHDLIARQQADVTRFTNPDRTIATPTSTVAAHAGPTTVSQETRPIAPVYSQQKPVAPQRKRPSKNLIAGIIAGVAVLVGGGVTAFLLLTNGDSTGGGSAPTTPAEAYADAYGKAPTCQELSATAAGGREHLTSRATMDNTDTPHCFWAAQGGGPDGDVTLHVQVKLLRSIKDVSSGAQKSADWFNRATAGSENADVGLGERAVWSKNLAGRPDSCELAVLDKNVAIVVSLGGSSTPDGVTPQCRPATQEIAKSVMAGIGRG